MPLTQAGAARTVQSRDWKLDSRLVLLNRCGHWAMIEHAGEFNRLVASFIKGSSAELDEFAPRLTSSLMTTSRRARPGRNRT